MNKYKLVLKYDGNPVNIELPFYNEDLIIIHNYSPYPQNTKTESRSIVISTTEFEHDIKVLLPSSIGNAFDNVIENFILLLKEHFKKFNRLLPSDYITYINEAIVIIIAISEQILKENVSKELAENYFNAIFQIIWKTFSQNIKDSIIHQGNQDNPTKYILQKLAN